MAGDYDVDWDQDQEQGTVTISSLAVEYAVSATEEGSVLKIANSARRMIDLTGPHEKGNKLLPAAWGRRIVSLFPL